MSREYAYRLFVLILAGFTTCLALANEEQDDEQAQVQVEQADRIRFPGESFQVDIAVSSRSEGQQAEKWKYRVLSKGNENTVVMVVEPASERGQIILMKGRELWIFLPNVSQPVRLSMAQRLTGQVANGDLARANFAGDYKARRRSTDSIEGSKYQVLELTAKDRGVTYHRVLYWLKEGSNAPYKAEFYALSGRLLKTGRYENYRNLLGKSRPTRLVLTDALRQGDESVLEYTEMKVREIPDKVFTKEYLKKLE